MSATVDTSFRRHRWACGRVPRTDRVAPRGFYRIPGSVWTTWSLVAGRYEYYLARRNAPVGRRR